MRRSRNFHHQWGGGGGGGGRSDKNSSDFFFKNYHFSRFQRGSNIFQGGGGPTFSREGGIQLLMIFQGGGGVWTPPSGSALAFRFIKTLCLLQTVFIHQHLLNDSSYKSFFYTYSFYKKKAISFAWKSKSSIRTPFCKLQSNGSSDYMD